MCVVYCIDAILVSKFMVETEMTDIVGYFRFGSLAFKINTVIICLFYFMRFLFF